MLTALFVLYGGYYYNITGYNSPCYKIYIMTKSIKTTPYLFIFNWMLNSCELEGFLAGILRDKTIANKFMFIPNDEKQN